MRPSSWHSRTSVWSRAAHSSAAPAVKLAGRSWDILVANDREGAARRLLDERLEIFKVLESLDLLRAQPRSLSLSLGRVRGITPRISPGGLSRHVSIAHCPLPGIAFC